MRRHKSIQILIKSVPDSQPSVPLTFSKANDSDRNEGKIHGLRRLRVWGKSVEYMRECPRPLVEVNR